MTRAIRDVYKRQVTLFSPEEFRRKLAAEDHFLHSVLKSKTIHLKGTLNELEETASRQ